MMRRKITTLAEFRLTMSRKFVDYMHLNDFSDSDSDGFHSSSSSASGEDLLDMNDNSQKNFEIDAPTVLDTQTETIHIPIGDDDEDDIDFLDDYEFPSDAVALEVAESLASSVFLEAHGIAREEGEEVELTEEETAKLMESIFSPRRVHNHQEMMTSPRKKRVLTEERPLLEQNGDDFSRTADEPLDSTEWQHVDRDEEAHDDWYVVEHATDVTTVEPTDDQDPPQQLLDK